VYPPTFPNATRKKNKKKRALIGKTRGKGKFKEPNAK
jgi:hypothetical protein